MGISKINDFCSNKYFFRELSKVKREKNKELESIAQSGTGDMYVDSARSIAVGIGVSDVKETMQDYEDQIAMAGRLTDADVLSLHILMEQASHELRQRKPEQALTYLMKGLKKDKTCIELLELKGKCYIDMNRYREALAAADEILIVLREKDNATALGVKASALYNMGDFEHALLAFYRYFFEAKLKNELVVLVSYLGMKDEYFFPYENL